MTGNIKTRTIRAFIAIETTREVKEKLSDLISHLEQNTGNWIRMIRPNSVHITLKFLGNVPEDQIIEVSEKVIQAASGQVPFYLTLGNIGAFPNRNEPKVLWIGLNGDLEAIRTLKSLLDNSLNYSNCPIETRLFHPHLTVARIKDHASNIQRKQAFATLQKINIEPLPIQVATISLMSSVLRFGHISYDLITAAPLKGQIVRYKGK